jgi:hypothetical protein
MHADFQPCAYIMASARRGTLYTGVTSHLIQRVCQHRDGSFGGFTDRYAVKRRIPTGATWRRSWACLHSRHPGLDPGSMPRPLRWTPDQVRGDDGEGATPLRVFV